MSKPRNLYPDTTLYVTCRCVNRSFRMVPSKKVNATIEYAIAAVSQRYREEGRGIQLHDYEVMSNHYHLLLHDEYGQVCEFLRDLNSVIAKNLNAIHGVGGSCFDEDPGIQTVLGDERVFEHCVYTLANAVAAGIVHKAAHWKGISSLRREYGKAYVIRKPKYGIWSSKRRLAGREGARRSGRAAFAGRSKFPEKAILMLDRPAIMPELSDAELRARIRHALAAREAKIAKARGNRPVLGMKRAAKIHWSYIPSGEEMFCRRPTFSTETEDQRKSMKRLRRKFLREYAQALRRWIAGEHSVVFPSGTVHMRLRFKAMTEPVPLDLLLAA